MWQLFFQSMIYKLVKIGVYWGDNLEDAQDATIEALVEVRRKWFAIDDREAYARRAVINHITKKQARERARVDRIIAQNAYTPEMSHDASLTEYEQRQWVEELLSALPRMQCAVMTGFFEGLSTGEIAAKIGSNPAAVRKNLELARRHLKAELTRRGEHPRASADPTTRKESQ